MISCQSFTLGYSTYIIWLTIIIVSRYDFRGSIANTLVEIRMTPPSLIANFLRCRRTTTRMVSWDPVHNGGISEPSGYGTCMSFENPYKSHRGLRDRLEALLISLLKGPKVPRAYIVGRRVPCSRNYHEWFGGSIPRNRGLGHSWVTKPAVKPF